MSASVYPSWQDLLFPEAKTQQLIRETNALLTQFLTTPAPVTGTPVTAQTTVLRQGGSVAPLLAPFQTPAALLELLLGGQESGDVFAAVLRDTIRIPAGQIVEVVAGVFPHYISFIVDRDTVTIDPPSDAVTLSGQEDNYPASLMEVLMTAPLAVQGLMFFPMALAAKRLITGDPDQDIYYTETVHTVQVASAYYTGTLLPYLRAEIAAVGA